MRFRSVSSTIGLALVAFLVGCRTTDPSPTAFGHRDAAELFGADHVPQFELTVEDSDWQWLQANAAKEEDVRARARYEGQPVGTIGLRFKGSAGTLANCIDKTGKLICAKLSFSLNFEKYDSGNRFFGLKRLNLHSMVNDPTKLHERIAYDLYQLSGIKAPRSSWANVTVNGKSYGLFSIVEAVDDQFTADRWPGNGHGNLYKEAWPKTTESSYYERALETNKATGKQDAIVAFANDLANSDSAGLSASLGKWIDLRYIARYLAVDDAIANCDGITALYAADATSTTSNNHNYYFYQEQHRDVFWLIPWDMDLTLTPCADFAAVPHWNTAPAQCDRNYQVWGDTPVRAPGCDRVFQAIANNRADYQAAVDQLLAGPFNARTVLGKIDRWSAFIHDSVVLDPTADGEGAWTSAVQELKDTIPILQERLLAIRDGRPLAPLSLSLTSNNDFEAATSLGAELACTIRASANLVVSQELRSTGALDGHRDIRLTFAYRGLPGLADDKSEHWVRYSMPFANGFQDLTSVAHVRLLLRTDQPRTVRIELASDLYRSSTTGARFGWDVAVTRSRTPVDLIVDRASLPPSAKDTTDSLRQVRTHVSGLTFSPSVVAPKAAGGVVAGKSYPSYLDIDDVQFLTR